MQCGLPHKYQTPTVSHSSVSLQPKRNSSQRRKGNNQTINLPMVLFRVGRRKLSARYTPVQVLSVRMCLTLQQEGVVFDPFNKRVSCLTPSTRGHRVWPLQQEGIVFDPFNKRTLCLIPSTRGCRVWPLQQGDTVFDPCNKRASCLTPAARGHHTTFNIVGIPHTAMPRQSSLP